MAMIQISAPGLAALQQGFEQAPVFTGTALLGAMTEAVTMLEAEVKDAMPAVSGLTRNSVTGDAFSTPAGVLGVVGSAAVAAAVVELGSRPHMPPVTPLVTWVQEVKGLSGKEATAAAWRIAMAIKRRGTKAQRPFARTLERAQPTLGQIFEGAAQSIAIHLAAQVGRGGVA